GILRSDRTMRARWMRTGAGVGALLAVALVPLAPGGAAAAQPGAAVQRYDPVKDMFGPVFRPERRAPSQPAAIVPPAAVDAGPAEASSVGAGAAGEAHAPAAPAAPEVSEDADAAAPSEVTSPGVVATAEAGEPRPPSAAQLVAALSDALADPLKTARLGLKPDALAAVAKVYAERGYAPIWTSEQGLRVGATILIEAFLRAGDDGLEPGEYPRRISGRSLQAVAELAGAELELSAALVRYAADLKVGRLAPTRTDQQGNVLRKEVDAAAVLAGAAEAGDLGAYLRSLAPANNLYAGLRRSLAEYRRAAGRGVWPAPAPDRLEPGNTGEPVERLRMILRATGDLVGSSERQDGAVFDEALATAVQNFQARHGLPADGVVGTETRQAMAVGVDERLRQILLNMERVRWLPDDLGDPHIMVNLAGFTLSYVEAGADAMTMRAIVGKPARSSPEFSGLITYLEVNPSWSVPRTIAIEDLLPKIRKDPRFLANNGFSLRTSDGDSVDAQSVNWSGIRRDSFPYALRQKPGPSNALGQVKFMFPNSFDVYLHDTPARGLFSQPVRAYSSGCIRLEKPVELAAKLLEVNGNWSDERLRGAIARGETRSVILNRPVSVHLTYLTSWRDPDGTVQFRHDIYGRDREMGAALVARGTQLLAAGGLTTVALP
ncbi:MAG TPA: L,D-transpeptidase family protein, partial [Rhodospirillales bacterium]|nr:L,D-transpeptidase family protein [Rhodospirillales bacterium]